MRFSCRSPMRIHFCRALSGHSIASAIPSQARIVIAGAGAVANSVAYHLVQNGYRDVTVLEQAKIGSGSSHFGSGILGLHKPLVIRNLIAYSMQLYERLQAAGHDLQLRRCGSVNVAQTADRLVDLKRTLASSRATGMPECELIGAVDVCRLLHGLVAIEDIVGGVWVPQDCVVNPRAVCDTLAMLATQGGATYCEHTAVEKVLTQNSRIYGVETNKGVIKCEYFVNCAGMWARELGLKGAPPVRIPAYPAHHFYATTGPLSQYVCESTPVLRDYDAFTYFREYEGGLMIGWFEKEAKPAFEERNVPRDWVRHLQTDYDHFRPLWEKAVDRIPSLAECTHPKVFNSPDNFTPDGRWILGEVPEISNYFVACGMNGNSLQGAGGIGKAVAEWIIEGKPTQELFPFNVQRFIDLHNNRKYLQQRVKEVVGRHYAILYPLQSEYKFGRKVRCSPLFSVLETRGAVFGVKMAYERALYFDPDYKRGLSKPSMPPGSFFKPKFLKFMEREYKACKETIGVIDMSSFSKIEIKSRGLEVVSYLQRLCSNDVDVNLNAVVHTGMLNQRGGYENDCMLVRQAENIYFMISPTSQQTRINDLLTHNLPTNSTITVNDVTSMYTVLNVVGPKAIYLLQALSNTDLRIPPFTYCKVNIGYASDVMVLSFTHTGEPGYCLYVPSEYALHVYYRLISVGWEYGVRDVGTLTQRFMRIERFIPFWAEELTSFTTPFETGHWYSVKLHKKDYFNGKDALLQQKKWGVTKKLVYFQIDDIDPDKDMWPWGGEPLFRNGEFVGTVTSTGYGFGTKKLICFGFIQKPRSTQAKTVTPEYILEKNAFYQIDIAGVRFPMTPFLHAPHITHVPEDVRPERDIDYKADINL